MGSSSFPIPTCCYHKAEMSTRHNLLLPTGTRAELISWPFQNAQTQPTLGPSLHPPQWHPSMAPEPANRGSTGWQWAAASNYACVEDSVHAGTQDFPLFSLFPPRYQGHRYREKPVPGLGSAVPVQQYRRGLFHQTVYGHFKSHR